MLRYWLDPKISNKGIPFEQPREGDAGLDIRAADSYVIEAGAQVLVSTGLHLAIPDGFVGLVKDRSSMALARIYSHAGVIDAAYRGEVKVVLSNHGDESYHIEAGSKVAQIVVLPCLTELEAAESLVKLGSTERGRAGFGSTGK